MKGLIVYAKEDYKRNEWFARRMIEVGESLGMQLRVRLVEDGLAVDGETFAIVRTFNGEINARLEALGVKCYNDAQTAKIANDKWQTYLLAKELNIPVMPTILRSNRNPAPLEYPVVMKSLDGHGGKQVKLLRSELDFQEAEKYERYLLQKVAQRTGEDMRVYVLRGEPIAAVLRRSKGDFRSNFSLGGEFVKCQPTEAQREYIRRIYERLGCHFVGIDFIYDGEWVLNEIEDCVGCRMLYALGEPDVVERTLSAIRLDFA